MLEDLKNGVGLKTVVETHQLANRRCVEHTLHRLQGEPMYMQPDPKKFAFVRYITRWLKHDEEGLYDEAFQWPYEKRVNIFRMPRRGAKITDPQLENCLLDVVTECGQEPPGTCS